MKHLTGDFSHYASSVQLLLLLLKFCDELYYVWCPLQVIWESVVVFQNF